MSIVKMNDIAWCNFDNYDRIEEDYIQANKEKNRTLFSRYTTESNTMNDKYKKMIVRFAMTMYTQRNRRVIFWIISI